jgi:integrase/recombinase XerD
MLRFVHNEYGISEIEEVNHLHFKGYIEKLIKSNLKETYINTLIRSFRAFFKYAKTEAYIILLIRLTGKKKR